MGKTFTFGELESLVPNVKHLLVDADSDAERLDILGEISSAERGLATLRRGTQVEYTDGDAGRKWRFEQSRQSVNSYNTPRLITDFARALKMPLWDAFIWLWRGDIIRISWQQTNLTKAVSAAGMTLVVAPHEIGEGDEEHIGTYWKDGYPSYKPMVEE